MAAIGCVCGLGVVAAIAYGSHAAGALDARILAHFIAPSGKAAAVARAIRPLGNLVEMLVMLAAACGIGVARGERRATIAALVVVAGANLTTQALKALFSHPRIGAILGTYHLAWDGFPSGHVTAVASIAVAFAFVLPARLRLLVALVGACVVLAMAWVVLALNMHYPSDVIGALFVTGAWGFATLAGLRQLEAGSRLAPQPERPAAISVK